MRLRLTYDQVIWPITTACSVLIGLGTLVLELEKLGLGPEWIMRLRIAALLAGVVAGVLGKSPLPGRGISGGRRRTDRRVRPELEAPPDPPIGDRRSE